MLNFGASKPRVGGGPGPRGPPGSAPEVRGIKVPFHTRKCWIIGQQTIAERNVDGVEFQMKQTKHVLCTLKNLF